MPRPPEHHRHPQRRLIDEHPVGDLAVLAEALPVIPDEGDYRRRRHAETFQPIDDGSNDGIVERNLTVVGMIPEPLGERRGRDVRIVRIVQVKPDEEGRAIGSSSRFGHLRGDPVLGELPCPIAAPLDLIVRRVPASSVKAIVVLVESARQARAPVENECADEGRGSIATIVQRRGERRHIIGHSKVAIVAHAVRERISAGEQADVSRQRDRCYRYGTLKEHALRREAIEGRRLRRSVAVRAEMVSACRVERDEENIRKTRGT